MIQPSLEFVYTVFIIWKARKRWGAQSWMRNRHLEVGIVPNRKRHGAMWRETGRFTKMARPRNPGINWAEAFSREIEKNHAFHDIDPETTHPETTPLQTLKMGTFSSI